MSQQKLTIIPVTLHAENKDLDPSISPTTLSNSICRIKTANAEISFLNDIDERKSNGLDFYEYIKTLLKDLPNIDIYQTPEILD